MLIVHLFSGLVFGALAAAVGVLMGFSLWVVAGCFLFGGNVGLLAGIPAALLRQPAKTPQPETI